MFKKVAIFGLGLLGGSICKALKKLDPRVEISAYGRNQKKLEKALEDGNVWRTGNISDADIKGIELIIVSIPVVSSVKIIKNVLGNKNLSEKSLVIDVGSVKKTIINALTKVNRADRFIGCHPMAGSEKTGYENSRYDLFHNSSVIITPGEFNEKEDIIRISRFWEALGSKIIVVSPEIHDFVISITSHLPHIISCLMIDVISEVLNEGQNKLLAKSMLETGSIKIDKNKAEFFIGKGFKDMTRTATGSPDMWTDICKFNSENIDKSIEMFLDKIDNFKKMLNNNDENNGVKLFLEKNQIL